MKLFNAKTFNYLTIMLSIIFFFSACISTIVSIQEEGRIALEFEQMMQDIETFNYNQLLENTDLIPDENTPTTALFTNGTDAFLYAYNEYVTAPTFYVISRGTSTNYVLGLTIDTLSKNIMVKFEDGSALYEMISYEPGNTYGRTNAKQIYYDVTTNLIYLRETGVVENINNELIAHYQDNWIYDTVSYFMQIVGFMPGEKIYDFTKKAVLEETYYKEVKVNNVVTRYETQIISNPTLAGKTFARIANYIGNATQMPVITQMKESAVINADGTLLILKFDDKFEVKTIIPILGEKTVKCDSKSTYQFITIGGEITVEKPDVSNATPR